MKVDITACYPRELDAGKILRTIWLLKGRLVVVADQIDGPKVEIVSYHWHGCPDAAWRVDDNWALLYAEPATLLWLSSPTFAISDADLHRLPGSCGQLTLSVQRKAVPVIRWLFSLNNERPTLEYDSGGRWIQPLGQRFSVE